MAPRLRLLVNHDPTAAWLESLFVDAFRAAGLRTAVFKPDAVDVGELIRDQRIEAAVLREPDYDQLESLQAKVRGVAVVRDPRDIVVKAHFASLNSHSTESPTAGGSLEAVPDLTGRWKHALTSVEPLLGRLTAWDWHDQRFLIVKGENLLSRPFETVMIAANELDLMAWWDAPVSKRIGTRWSRTWNRMTRKLRGRASLPSLDRVLPPEAILRATFARRHHPLYDAEQWDVVQPGSPVTPSPPLWRRLLDDDALKMIEERHADLLRDLGYSRDST